MKTVVHEGHELKMKSGLLSSVGFSNPRFIAGLNTMFEIIEDDEVITEVEIKADSITVKIESPNQSEKE